MSDEDKTREQLIHEFAKTNGGIPEFEVSQSGLRHSEQELNHKKEFYWTLLESLPI
jgi:hypothetical protein